MSDRPVCARPRCGRHVPPVALRYRDPYCSRRCMEIHLGIEVRSLDPRGRR